MIDYLKYLDGYRGEGDATYQNGLKELSRVRISVHSRLATKITRSARVSFSSQLANLGYLSVLLNSYY